LCKLREEGIKNRGKYKFIHGDLPHLQDEVDELAKIFGNFKKRLAK